MNAATQPIEFSDFTQLITVLLTLTGFIVAFVTYKARTAQSRAEWTASLIGEFLLHERNISVRRNLELFYEERLNNYIQSILSGDNPLLHCSPEEIQATRELEDFLAQLEFFCYLESRKTISTEDLDASLGFWLSFLKEDRFIALRAYLQENSFEYLVKRLGGEIKLNRILVYGTLKSGTKKHEEFGLNKCSTSLGFRDIPGEMFAVNSAYPGANLSLDVIFSNFNVPKYETFKCELLEIDLNKAGMSDLLRKLDDYENEGDSQEYRRYLIPCDGATAWIYDYIEETELHEKIESGFWD
jgi:gamma-glutamylcyclotransferase (GGCT)/AIG2-like uncharacterized protein YtfP